MPNNLESCIQNTGKWESEKSHDPKSADTLPEGLTHKIDTELEFAMEYLRKRPARISEINAPFSKWDKENPLDDKGRNIPSTFYRMIAKVFFDTLREYFGSDVIVDGSIVGSVANGSAKLGSDIDGAIYVAVEYESRIDEIKAMQQKIFQYVAEKIGRQNIQSCDFGANVFTIEQALSGHLSSDGPRIPLSRL
jgi:hypothetical protein